MIYPAARRDGTISRQRIFKWYLKDHQAVLMVLDMIMDPGMDGLDTHQSIHGVRPKQKAIIVSGFSETDRAKKAQRRGAGAYVKKPYIVEKIGVAIRDEQNRQLAALQLAMVTAIGTSLQ